MIGNLDKDERKCASEENLTSDFDFLLTEGENRRDQMDSCKSDCSKILDYLYVGGAEIAGSKETLQMNKICRVINCASDVVENHFINDSNMKYLSLNMVDGKEDDISWFLCSVLHFIQSGIEAKEGVLLHCEKGVSRSCSFAIAYYMWTTGINRATPTFRGISLLLVSAPYSHTKTLG